MHIHLVEPEVIYDLRHKVLREGNIDLSPSFDGDHDPSTAHYAVYDDNNILIACATLLENTFQGKKARQLRGMAVDSTYQGKGIGSQLLHYIENHQPIPARDLWCNARTSAVMFYKNHGWKTVGETFDIPTVGPHIKMYRHLYNT